MAETAPAEGTAQQTAAECTAFSCQVPGRPCARARALQGQTLASTGTALLVAAMQAPAVAEGQAAAGSRPRRALELDAA